MKRGVIEERRITCFDINLDSKFLLIEIRHSHLQVSLHILIVQQTEGQLRTIFWTKAMMVIR